LHINERDIQGIKRLEEFDFENDDEEVLIEKFHKKLKDD